MWTASWVPLLLVLGSLQVRWLPETEAYQMPAAMTIVCPAPFAKRYRDELSRSADCSCSEDTLVPTPAICSFSWVWVRFYSPDLESPKLGGTRYLQEKKRRNVELKNIARMPFLQEVPLSPLGVFSRREGWMPQTRGTCSEILRRPLLSGLEDELRRTPQTLSQLQLQRNQ